jgi:Kef-type K+ transport system membrane component KefB
MLTLLNINLPHVSDFLLVILSLVIILSYFFNVYSKKSGVPSVLLLIGVGLMAGLATNYFTPAFKSNNETELDLLLKVLGTFGLILIVLEAALDLKLLKEKISIIVKSLSVAIIALGGTSIVGAWFLSYFFVGDIGVLNKFSECLLITIPLSVLSSAIILPSIGMLENKKREFLIYESTFSDIVGIIAFGFVMSWVNPGDGSESSDVSTLMFSNFGDLFFTIVLSLVISYVLIYLFQKLKDHGKLFLLIAVLLFLYSLGHMFGFASLLIILIFGLVLNNYSLFFRGVLKEFVLEENVNITLKDFTVVTTESAFVVRTFFFILFGWSVSISSLFDYRVWLIGVPIIVIIYLIRFVVLLVFNATFKFKKINPVLFLAPRGLITVLLFYSAKDFVNITVLGTPGFDFGGVLLFVILTSCLIMSWSLVGEKKRIKKQEEEDFEILEKDEVLEEEN